MRSGSALRENAARALSALSLMACAVACGSQRAVLIEPGAGGSGSGSSGAGANASCPALLSQRLTVTTIDVAADIGYVESGYDGFPLLSRIELASQPDGASQVAWQAADRQTIRVTPLGPDQARRGDDVVVDGLELGGLVAHDDGFALLARRPDPGQDISVDPNEMGTQAAFLVRSRGGQEAFALDLTGTASPKPSLSYTSSLAGQLAWNGSQYGAYFKVHAGTGAPEAGLWADQLSYADDTGAFLDGGWAWGSTDDTGLRLLAEDTVPFSAACFTYTLPQAGLLWMTESQQQHLAFEEEWAGYTAGRFGAIAKVSDGTHIVVWASRGDGGQEAGTDAHARAKDAPDLALQRVAADGTAQGPVTWLTNTPDVAEFTVHLAPYGTDRYLLLWSALSGCQYTLGNCYGNSMGTFARIIDANGEPMSGDEELPAWPGDDSQLAVFPNGDIGWGFVDSLPSYAARIDVTAVPPMHTLSVARLRYCQSQ